MPAKNHLTQEQKSGLLHAIKESDNPYIREKILILLLMNRHLQKLVKSFYHLTSAYLQCQTYLLDFMTE